MTPQMHIAALKALHVAVGIESMQLSPARIRPIRQTLKRKAGQSRGSVYRPGAGDGGCGIVLFTVSVDTVYLTHSMA